MWSQEQPAALPHPSLTSSSHHKMEDRQKLCQIFWITWSTTLHRDSITLTFPKSCCMLWGTHSPALPSFPQNRRVPEVVSHWWRSPPTGVDWNTSITRTERCCSGKKDCTEFWTKYVVTEKYPNIKNGYMCVNNIWINIYTWNKNKQPCLLDKWTSSSLLEDCSHTIWTWLFCPSSVKEMSFSSLDAKGLVQY